TADRAGGADHGWRRPPAASTKAKTTRSVAPACRPITDLFQAPSHQVLQLPWHSDRNCFGFRHSESTHKTAMETAIGANALARLFSFWRVQCQCHRATSSPNTSGRTNGQRSTAFAVARLTATDAWVCRFWSGARGSGSLARKGLTGSLRA